jgi:hypothetical protein
MLVCVYLINSLINLIIICIFIRNFIEETMSLVEASDKYQLNELKNRCLRSLCTQITQDNVGRIAIISYLHNAELMIQEEIRHYCRRY